MAAHHIRWFPYHAKDNVLCGILNTSTLHDCEVEHWVHSVRGDLYEPLVIVRAYQNGRTTLRRVRLHGANVPDYIDNLQDAQRLLEEYFGINPQGGA